MTVSPPTSDAVSERPLAQCVDLELSASAIALLFTSHLQVPNLLLTLVVNALATSKVRSDLNSDPPLYLQASTLMSTPGVRPGVVHDFGTSISQLEKADIEAVKASEQIIINFNIFINSPIYYILHI
jgi:hypothetical protein